MNPVIAISLLVLVFAGSYLIRENNKYNLYISFGITPVDDYDVRENKVDAILKQLARKIQLAEIGRARALRYNRPQHAAWFLEEAKLAHKIFYKKQRLARRNKIYVLSCHVSYFRLDD